MAQYSDYEDLLLTYNFVGGAGQNEITEISGDSRTQVNKVNGFYQLKYFFLTDFSNPASYGYDATLTGTNHGDTFEDMSNYITG